MSCDFMDALIEAQIAQIVSGGGGGHTIEYSDVAVTPSSTLNFTGGVRAVNDGTDIDVSVDTNATVNITTPDSGQWIFGALATPQDTRVSLYAVADQVQQRNNASAPWSFISLTTAGSTQSSAFRYSYNQVSGGSTPTNIVAFGESRGSASATVFDSTAFRIDANGNPRMRPDATTPWSFFADYGATDAAAKWITVAGLGPSGFHDSSNFTQTFDNGLSSPESIFKNGIILGSNAGLVSSTVADGVSAVALDVVDTIARTQGQSFRITNSALSRTLMQQSWDGRLTVGYQSTASPQTGHVLSFVQNTSDSPTGALHYVGILGLISHSDASETPLDLLGVVGAVTINSGATVPTTDIVVGTVGFAASASDTTGYSAKVLAGLRAKIGQQSGVTADIEANRDTSVLGPSGDWAHVTGLWVDALASTKTPATNRPAICSGARLPIPNWSSTAGEQWALYIDTTTPSFSVTAAIAGGIRIPFPPRGTRKTHLYLIPTAAEAGGPTTNIVGDLYFDASGGSGGGNTVGLYEHDGTAWRKHLTPDKAYTIAGAWTFTGGATITTADWTITDRNIVFSTGTGTKFGTATGQKHSLWNATPIIQPAGAAQAALTNSSGGTGDGTIAACASVGVDIVNAASQADVNARMATINDNFTEVFTLLDAIRTAMVNYGSMKGAA